MSLLNEDAKSVLNSEDQGNGASASTNGGSGKPTRKKSQHQKGQKVDPTVLQDDRLKVEIKEEAEPEHSTSAIERAKKFNLEALKTDVNTLATGIASKAAEGKEQADREAGAYITAYSEANYKNTVLIANNLDKLRRTSSALKSRIAPEAQVFEDPTFTSFGDLGEDLEALEEELLGLKGSSSAHALPESLES